MQKITELGGICVYGIDTLFASGRESGLTPMQVCERLCIRETPISFESDTYAPDVILLRSKTAEGERETKRTFQLPCNRGQRDYEIHFLSNGDLLVRKESYLYICTHKNDIPKVLTWKSVPSDIEDVLRVATVHTLE